VGATTVTAGAVTVVEGRLPAVGRYALIGRVGNSPLRVSNGPIVAERRMQKVMYALIHESSNFENFSFKIFCE
jgi:hypothetical protein